MVRQVSSGDLEFLDLLKTSRDLWVHRADEGQAIATHIAASASPLVVLYGPPRFGNTDLIERWVIPVLSERHHVIHRTIDTAASDEDGTDAAIEILDDFETYLVDTPASRTVIARLARLTAEPGNTRKFVLVLQEDYLSRLFQLRDTLPHIVDDVFEVPEVSCEGFQEALARVCASYGIHLAPSFRGALLKDLDAAHSRAASSPDVIAVIAFELCRVGIFNRELTNADYRAIGGLSGILQAHLDLLFDNLPHRADPTLGWAIARQVLYAPPSRPTELVDIADRFDVPVDVPAEILQWLERDRRILRGNAEGGHDLVPGLLAVAVDARIRKDDESTEPVHWILRQGLRRYTEIDALLPVSHFRRIHAQRSLLVVNEDEARLMARCALSYPDSDFAPALDHWLRRVRDPSAKTDLLLEALFDSRPDVRQRAAARLRHADRPDVQVQLQLLALRDPSPAVRAAAVDSMAATTNEALKSSLRQEVRDPNSPYRLEATEALRVFTDRDTVDTLLGIVSGNAEINGLGLRAKAIEALGSHNTKGSIEALLKVALQDADPEDRVAATEALARLSTAESAAFAVESLRTAGTVAAPLRARVSPKSVAQGAACAAMVIGAVFVNLLLFGFILATLRKWRAAAAVSAAEIVTLLLVFVINPFPWPVVLAIGAGAFFVGFLAPTRTLLLERQANMPQGGYRRWLGGVLFAAGSVTAFLVVHGLPFMLTRRIRRGLVLVGFEVAGWFILTNGYFLDQLSLGGNQGSSSLSLARYAPWLMIVTGIGVAVLTYAVGVGTVFKELFLLGNRRRMLDRIDGVWRGLLRNSAVQALVLERFTSNDPNDARWATRTVKKYRNAIQSQIPLLWDGAAASSKRRIFSAMAMQPNPDSLDFVKAHAPALGPRGRIRYVLALWNFRQSVWPKPVLIVLPLSILILGLYVAGLREFALHNPVSLLEKVQAGDASAATALGALTKADRPHVAAMATTSLQLALDNAAVRGNSKVLEAVFGALPASTGLRMLEDSIGSLLSADSTSAGTRSLAIAALARIGSAEAAHELSRFVRFSTARQLLSTEQFNHDGPVDASVEEAVVALAGMHDAGTTPLRMLLDLESSPALPQRVRTAAKDAAAGADPVLWSQFYIQNLNYDQAIRAASGARPAPGDTAYARRVANALGSAHNLRGLEAINTQPPDYERAKSDLASTLAAGPDEADVLASTSRLAERLVFELHEHAAANDPIAFAESYRILASVEKLGSSLWTEARISLTSNLAEAALTAGRHEEARDRALAVVGDAMGAPVGDYRDAILNMKLIALAAVVLLHDAGGAKQALADVQNYYQALPAGFQNLWVYTGTLQYIDDSSLSPRDKQMLRDTIALISRRR
jgi:hypothetical protein